jgi:hypothetical protein
MHGQPTPTPSRCVPERDRFPVKPARYPGDDERAERTRDRDKAWQRRSAAVLAAGPAASRRRGPKPFHSAQGRFRLASRRGRFGFAQRRRQRSDRQHNRGR